MTHDMTSPIKRGSHARRQIPAERGIAYLGGRCPPSTLGNDISNVVRRSSYTIGEHYIHLPFDLERTDRWQ
jgi:hypothetical protein